MNIIDKVIEAFNPAAALKRQQARMGMELIRTFQNSGYDESGASRTKNSMRGWSARSKSPQEDIDKNLPTLRQRSRSLYMSAPLAASAIKTNRTNVVGEGLKLKSTIDYSYLGMTPEAAAEWQRQAEREFELWAKSKFCDAIRSNNFYEIQQTALMSWLMNGDACVLVEYERPTKFFPYGLRVRLIESDRVSTPHTTGNTVNLYAKDLQTGNRIYNGVELNDAGQIVAYHICSTYPNSNLHTEKKWTRVKAFGDKTGIPNVLMIYETERPEQYRGVPYLAPVIDSLKQLTRYSEAEQMAAVINGFFTVFITSESGAQDVGFTGVVPEGEEVTNDNVSYELGPGMVNMLNPGEKVEIADAKRPSTNFDAFVTALSKYIGAALEIPVELLTKNFTSSYSASRAALLEAWKAFRMKRAWLAADFCQPIYEIFLIEAISSGRLKAPGFFLDPMIKKAYSGAQWNGPAQGMIDPVKEVDAAKERISIGISTRQKETIEMTGGDFEANVAQLARENDLMKEYGISGAAPSAPAKNKTEKENVDDEEGNEEGKVPEHGDTGAEGQ